METDKMSTASSVGAERRPLMQALVVERRILFAATILVGLCTFLWITAVCTSKWVHIQRDGTFNATANGTMFLSSDSGVWEVCRNEFKWNATSTSPKPNGTVSAQPCVVSDAVGQCYTLCTNYLAIPPEGLDAYIDPAYDEEIASLVRTMTSFGIISLFVMAMGCGFSMYTFRNPRYMFKRLAAGIHFISTSCTFVVVQVMTNAVDDFRKRVPTVYPRNANHYYHISFYLALFVVLVNFCSAAAFLWYSRKRKGDKAATEELGMADEPTIIGR